MPEQEKIASRYIQIAEPYMGDEEWQALKEPIITGWLTQGPKVKVFEQGFAARHDVTYAHATTSCTTALHLALSAIDIKPGDRVIVPSFTWIATANAVEYCGGIPVFCDSCRDTYNMDPEKLERVIERLLSAGIRPKAVIAVHLFGLSAEMDKISSIAKKYNMKVIEDAACAAGARYKGKATGSLGDIGCFSFHPRKVLTTGEGGMCTTNDKDLAERISCLRSHGASLSEEQRHHSNSPYLMPNFDVLGYNYRMSDLQGAVGVVQLSKLDSFIAERRAWAQYYQKELSTIEWLVTPKEPDGCFHSFQAYVCLVDEKKIKKSRNKIMQHLHEHGIGTRAGTHAVHQLGYYEKKYDLKPSDYPVARELYASTLALPLHNRMAEEDYYRVVEVLKKLDVVCK
jgi:perosamine synthetase